MINRQAAAAAAQVLHNALFKAANNARFDMDDPKNAAIVRRYHQLGSLNSLMKLRRPTNWQRRHIKILIDRLGLTSGIVNQG